MTVALSGWWVFGWIVGAVVIATAALLLLACIALARRIAGQADAITEALDGTREHTDPLWAMRGVNVNLARIVGGLKLARNRVTSR